MLGRNQPGFVNKMSRTRVEIRISNSPNNKRRDRNEKNNKKLKEDLSLITTATDLASNIIANVVADEALIKGEKKKDQERTK